MQTSGGGREGQGAATRALIGHAAREMFAEKGYGGTSVRAIAATVGVDAALVIRYFGSKERLFLETVQMPGLLDRVLEQGPPETLGRRIVAALFDGDVEGRVSVFGHLVRASDSEQVRQRLREAGERTLFGPLGRRLQGPGADLRARLIGAQINGLLWSLTLDPELDPGPDGGAAARDELIATYGRALQVLIDPPV